jgi:hypothetical protein
MFLESFQKMEHTVHSKSYPVKITQSVHQMNSASFHSLSQTGQTNKLRSQQESFDLSKIF